MAVCRSLNDCMFCRFFFFLFVSYGTLMPTVHDCGCGRGIPHWLFGGSLAGVEVARNADFQKGG